MPGDHLGWGRLKPLQRRGWHFGARVFRQMYVHLDCHITIFIKIDLNPEHCSVDAVHVAGLFFGSNPSTSCTNVASAVKCCSAAAPLQSVEKGMPISRATSTRSRTRPTYQSLGLVPLFRLSAVPPKALGI